MSYVKAKAKGNAPTAEQAIAVMLVIAAAVGLTYLLASLACSLSCSGSEGFAILVAVFGLSAVIFGSILLIRAITGHQKKHQTVIYNNEE